MAGKMNKPSDRRRAASGELRTRGRATAQKPAIARPNQKIVGSASATNQEVQPSPDLTPDQVAALAIQPKKVPPKAETKKRATKQSRKPEDKATPTPAPEAKKAAAKHSEEAVQLSAANDEPHEPEAGKPGRPTTYTQEIADRIIERISEGETLRQICRDEGMPAWRTVYDWKQANEAFSARFAHARVAGFDAIAEDTINMLDETPERTATEFGDKVDPGYVQWQKNRVEQRMKLLAKWSPKYADKVDLNHGGQEGNPVQVATKVVVVPAKQTAAVETKKLEGDDRSN